MHTGSPSRSLAAPVRTHSSYARIVFSSSAICAQRSAYDTGLTAELLHPIRGFNRRIGYSQAVAETRSVSANIRRSVERVALRDDGQAAVRAKLDAKDTAAFWDLVRSVVEPELAAHARRAAVFATRDE